MAQYIQKSILFNLVTEQIEQNIKVWDEFENIRWRELTQAEIQALEAENTAKQEKFEFLSKDHIETSLGRLKKQTHVGALPVLMANLDVLVNKLGTLPAGTVRFYDEENNYVYNEELAKEQFDTLYLEVFQAYREIDQMSGDY